MWFLFIYCVQRHFQQSFSDILATSFSGGRNRNTQRTTDHGQATGKLYHLRLLVECALFIIYKAGPYNYLTHWSTLALINVIFLSSIIMQQNTNVTHTEQRAVMVVIVSYGSWIDNYLCSQWLSQITLCVRIPFMEVYSIQHYVIKFVSVLW